MILRIAEYSDFKKNLLYGGVILKNGLDAKKQGRLIYGCCAVGSFHVSCGDFKEHNNPDCPSYIFRKGTVFPKNRLYKYLMNK
jgi:hypothetical protein